MADFNALSASLQGEVLVDIAGGFFGPRKALDDERELFEHVENNIRLAEQRALTVCAQLQALLTCEDCMKELLSTIGVPAAFLSRIESAEPWLSMKLPFALTREGQYKKCVLQTYERLYEAFGFFLHGMPYEEKDTEEKHRRTTGYYRYLEWCDELNERIVKVNRDHSPSQVLSVVREMDVEKIAKQKAVGTVNAQTGCMPGDDLCLMLVPCEGLKALELPELPAPDKKIHTGHSVSSLIKKCAQEIYHRERSNVQRVMDELKHN